MSIDFVRSLLAPNRSQMIQEVAEEFLRISLYDPITRGEDVPEFIEWLLTLSNDELRTEWESIKAVDT